MGMTKAAMTVDEAAVHGVVEAMSAALNAGDLGGVMASYRPGAVVVGALGQRGTHGAALEEMFRGFFASGFAARPGAHEVVVAGDFALHLMAWTAPGPDGLEMRALSVAVMTRGPDGAWRMVIDHPFGDGVMQAD